MEILSFRSHGTSDIVDSLVPYLSSGMRTSQDGSLFLSRAKNSSREAAVLNMRGA